MNNAHNISKITLGTVQLGLNYGVTNKSGQPSRHDSHQLLQFALDSGIQSVDTARIYGEAEEVIGSFVNTQLLTVISKFKLSDAALENRNLAIEEARESIRTSCQLLHRNRIPIVLFHKNREQEMQKAAPILSYVFKTLISEGWMEQGGISVYNAGELKHIKEWENLNAIQVPVNVFDTRLLDNENLEILAKHKVMVFARSIYLQGLLAVEGPLPAALSFAASYYEKLQLIARKANLTVKELSFYFIRDTPCITSMVVGAETIEQLRENMQLMHAPPLPEDIYQEITTQFKNVPEEIITPALWKITTQ